MICLSGVGSLNVKTYTAARVTQAAAEREHLPPVLRTLARKKFDEPIEEMDDSPAPSLSKWSFLHRPTRYKDGSIPLYVRENCD
jgi:hypothetical protein